MAQAILLKDVETLGERGDLVEVSNGYLRNYLLPRKLAQRSTKGELEAAKRRIAAEEQAKRDARERADEYVGLLSRTVLTIAHNASEDGRLFGSVTTKEIAEAIQAARGIRLDRRKIELPEPIKQVGTYMVTVEITTGTTATVKTIVVAKK